jgi:hypothetical protein
MTVVIALPRSPHSEFLAKLRSIQLGLGARGAVGVGLGAPGRAAAAAVPWWLSGGVAAANAVAVYQPIRSASLAVSYVNLANPGTYDAAPGTAPSFNAATGWTFNGGQWLTTNLELPEAEQNWSMIVRFSDVTNGGSLAGVRNSSTLNFQIIPNTGSGVGFWHWTQSVSGANATSGVLAIAGASGYRNGIAETSMTTPAYFPGRKIAIGATGSLTVVSPIAAKIQGFSIYNTTLTSTQVAAISAAMAAL